MANIDIGSLKLHFNNEVLKAKKYILQAKTQIIHKLTRNIQKLKKRKGTDEELKTFNAKSESIVAEIMFIKKIDHHELSKFAIRNFDNLTKLMDTPVVTKEKAMAKLLSHKCLKSRFEQIVKQFSIVPPDTLLQTNPKKLRKKEKQNKEKQKKNSKAILDQAEDTFSEPTENIIEKDSPCITEDAKSESDEIIDSEQYSEENDSENESLSIDKNIKQKTYSKIEKPSSYSVNSDSNLSDASDSQGSNEPESDKILNSSIKKSVPKSTNSKIQNSSTLESHKNKTKKKNKISDLYDEKDSTLNSETTVDSFFKTESGDSYLTVALPRKPDVLPSYHEEESIMNRKMRRAALYGNEFPRKRKTQKNPNFPTKNERFQNSSDIQGVQRNFSETRPIKSKYDSSLKSKEEEKLHPSWEAKKKKSTLVAFEGKKVVFDD